MNNCESYFRTWQTPNDEYVADPDSPNPEEAKPFVVCLSFVRVLVFARDEDHAKNRVLLALQECDQECYHKEASGWGVTQARRLLAQLKDGSISFEVEPYDIAVMTGVQWACNGGLGSR